ncbi:MAG: hypothetical protein ACJAXS_001219 [Colwellia sp.]|jgi:hypothetical protein
MKKIILAIALLTLTSSLSAHSEETETALMDAPNDYVASLLIQCKEYAVEDEIAEADMKTYLLDCVNDELKEGYYKPIIVLPKGE